VRLPEQQPHRRGVHALIAQVARREKFPNRFDIFVPRTFREFAVQPEAGERLPRGRFRLRDLVFVVREDQVDAAGVKVERLGAAALPDLLERHRGASECHPPARPNGASHAAPTCSSAGSAFFHSAKSRGSSFAYSSLRPAPDLELPRVESRQPSVVGNLAMAK